MPLRGYVLVGAALQASLRGFHDDAIDMSQGAYGRGKHTPPSHEYWLFLPAALIDARAGVPEAEALYNLGRLLQQQDRPQEAEDAYRRALDAGITPPCSHSPSC